MKADDVLEFWFQQCRPWQWFRRRDSFDSLVRERFGESVERAITGDLNHWSCAPSSGLALVLLLDQFTRQMWRGEAKGCKAFGLDTFFVLPRLTGQQSASSNPPRSPKYVSFFSLSSAP